MTASFWDTETTDQENSNGGVSKSTSEMHTASTFINAGWNLDDPFDDQSPSIWRMNTYPQLSWEPFVDANDADSDDLSDGWEIQYFGDLISTDGTIDSDGDGLLDQSEFEENTNPTNRDSDGDSLDDGSEIYNGLNPNVPNGNASIFSAYRDTLKRAPGQLTLDSPEIWIENGQIKIRLQIHSGSGLDSMSPLGDPLEFTHPLEDSESGFFKFTPVQ